MKKREGPMRQLTPEEAAEVLAPGSICWVRPEDRWNARRVVHYLLKWTELRHLDLSGIGEELRRAAASGKINVSAIRKGDSYCQPLFRGPEIRTVWPRRLFKTFWFWITGHLDTTLADKVGDGIISPIEMQERI